MNFPEFTREIYSINEYAKMMLKPSFYHEPGLMVEVYVPSRNPIEWCFIANNPSIDHLFNDLDLVLTHIKQTIKTKKSDTYVSVGHDPEHLTSIRTKNDREGELIIKFNPLPFGIIGDVYPEFKPEYLHKEPPKWFASNEASRPSGNIEYPTTIQVKHSSLRDEFNV